MPGTSVQAQVSPAMRHSFGIVITLLASILSVIEGEYPIAFLFLCGTAMFVVESVGRRMRRVAWIVDGAREVVRQPVAPAAGEAARPHDAPDSSTQVPGPR